MSTEASRLATIFRRQSVSEILSRYGVFFGLVVVVIVFSIASPVFLTPDNLLNIGRQSTFLAIVAFGMTFVIISGEIDISVGSVAAASSVTIASLLAANTPIIVAIGAGVLLGGAIGLINGLVITYGRVPSFIMTLGMLNIVRGLSLASTNASTIVFENELYRGLFSRFTYLGVPAPIIFGALLFVLLYILLHHTRYGAHVIAAGGSAELSRLAGIAVNRLKVSVFVLSGAVAALSAVISTARVGNGQPEADLGTVLNAIAAVVIGGTSFAGGRGALPKTILGALLIGTLNNGLTLMQVNFDWQLVARGAVIVLAVFADVTLRRTKEAS
jgi:ribose transport system permease protein